MAADRPPPKIMITVEEGSGRDDAGGMMPSVLPLTGRTATRSGGRPSSPSAKNPT